MKEIQGRKRNMDKTFYQIVDDCIVKNIPSSVKINETIYDYQKIADIFIDGKLIMRTEISEISHVDNFFMNIEIILNGI